MQIEVKKETAQKIAAHLEAAGVMSGDESRNVERFLDILADCPDGMTLRQIVERLKSQKQHASRSESAFEVAKRLGLIGAHDGPADLSTNPEYMNGFGQ